MLLLSPLNTSDWIAVAGIVVNAILGLIIVVVVSNRLSNKRALKDYFINEIKDIRDGYRKFLNELFGSRYDFVKTNSWFQVMNMRLIDLEKVLAENYGGLNLPIKELNQQLRDIITGDEDFNNSFKKSSVTINQRLKLDIIRKHSEISTSLTKTIVKINKN